MAKHQGWASWAGWAIGARRGRRARPGRHRLRPAVLALEGRRLLATFTVTSTGDGTTGSGDSGTLPYCIAQANSNNQANTIVFDAQDFGSHQTIDLGGSLLRLSDTGGTQTITGPAAGVTIDGEGLNNVFQIDSEVTASLSGLTITGGSSSGGGGGILSYGTLTLSGCTISGNSADGAGTGGGGGVFNLGTLTLQGCTISGNYVGSYGGGLDNRGTATLTDCTISGNSAVLGGGMTNIGTATLTDCTISGNSAAKGGGLFNYGTGTLHGCTISGNFATFGAGLDNGGIYSTASIGLQDCTISANTASSHGGGLLNDKTATLQDCTISGNSAGSDGGVYDYAGLINSTYYVADTTLTGTIVAGNTAGGAASDIGGAGAASHVSGSNNLIGTGGSGGLGSGDNLLGVADPLLGALANNGGPTQTMALLPGSPAIGAGVAVSGITTDQRGVKRPDSAPDIGAFQDQGFTVAVSSGNDQSTTVGQAFADDLVVSVSSPYGDPVAGGVVTFAPPGSGASAFLGSPTATIGSDGTASTGATADEVQGTYTVTASTAGATAAAGFTLTNTGVLTTFSRLAAPTIVYGTANVTLGGTILAGSAWPPGSVAITLDGVTQDATIGLGGRFSSVFATAGLGVAGSPYTITYAYAARGKYTADTDTAHALTVTRATPAVVVSDAGGLANGQPFPATATVTGVSGVAATSLEGVTPSLTYYSGATASGTPLAGAPSAPGEYTVLASFAGSADYGAASATATF